ncbi:MAG: FtsW/RodA/SpoVE family cell cycle protein [Chloroflexi bacterium]|nr:FtsW/RodA/SpoVE family cell cycle protein [Chloroflexota bacterium]
MPERWPLVLAGVFVLVNHIALALAQDRHWSVVWPVGVWSGCALLGHTLLERYLPRRDPLLFPLAMLLTGWGLNLIARLVPSYTVRQTAWLVVGWAALLLVAAFPECVRWLQRYRYTLLFGGLGLLLLTIGIGANPSGQGPQLWLGFGEVYYQPSELLKVLLVAFLASYFADHQRAMRVNTVRVWRWQVPSPSFLAPVLLMWGVCVVVLVWQQDLGTATLFFVVFMLMLYLASGQIELLLGGLVLLLLAGAAAYLAFDVVALRVDIWWNPWATADTKAYQVVQSLIAFGEGGVLGQGIGQGEPGIIPVVHSDFVFAAVAEEWGVLGALAAVSALVVLVVRGMRIAVQIQDPFRSLLAAGLSLALAVQSLLIMTGVLRILPLTGVTLPFVSYGGSSLLTSFTIIGLLLVLSDEVVVEW